MRIAIMQPYFLPYAGYFRLMAGVDLFVVLDNVQFPRRGWVHRNRLARSDGTPAWLTLPLRQAPMGTGIRQLAFHPKATQFWSERRRRFPACTRPGEAAAPLVELLAGPWGSPLELITGLLERTAGVLGYRPDYLLASGLGPLPPGQAADRMIAICARLGADVCVNAPNGRHLYTPGHFAEHGIRLEFLPDYRGDHLSILQRLHDTPLRALRAEIDANLK